MTVSQQCLYFKISSSKGIVLCWRPSASCSDWPIKGVRIRGSPGLVLCSDPDFSRSSSRRARGRGHLSLSEKAGIRPSNRQVEHKKSIDRNPSVLAGGHIGVVGGWLRQFLRSFPWHVCKLFQISFQLSPFQGRVSWEAEGR